MHCVRALKSTFITFEAWTQRGGEEVRNVFYLKWNKLCSVHVITILLIVAYVVMYLPSNHVVYSVVVVLFLNFTQKFHSSLFGFFFISFVLLLIFLLIYVLICLFYCQITSHNYTTNNKLGIGITE